MFEIIRAWYHKRMLLRDIRYKHNLLGKMLRTFTFRVLDRVKDDHADVTLSTFNQMVIDVSALIDKHNGNLSNIEVKMELKGNEFISQEVARYN